MCKEEYVYYLSKKIGHNGNDNYIGIGSSNFTPLELNFKSETDIKKVIPGDKLYVGEGSREVVKSIIGRAEPLDFEGNDHKFLQEIINKIISENETRFVDFFNNSEAYSMKRHSLSLIPGVGPKVLAFILKERKIKQINSINDLKERCEQNNVPFIPLSNLSKRIVLELCGKTKERIFVK